MGFVRSLILAAVAVCLLPAESPSHARSFFGPPYGFWWGDHQFRSRHKHQHKRAKADLTTKHQVQDASKGPLQIIVSIADQRISLYDNGTLIARSSVSTGVEGHPTPLGVFSVLSKNKWHRSNIYSAAPMPYMQRITWSGIALHAGHLPGYPASHGCIRLTNDFAIRLWHLTKRGARVIIAREDVRPIEIANSQLFVPKPKVASAPPETVTATLATAATLTATAPLASHDSLTTGSARALPMSTTGGTSGAASAAVAAPKVGPISIFVSRQLSKLFVRRGFTPLFETPVKIRNLAEPTGTHVFSAMELQGATMRWIVVSIPETFASASQTNPSRLRNEPTMLDKANAALERIEIPQDAVDRISELLTPGSSLIISDHGISHETGKDTDFIVLTR